MHGFARPAVAQRRHSLWRLPAALGDGHDRKAASDQIFDQVFPVHADTLIDKLLRRKLDKAFAHNKFLF